MFDISDVDAGFKMEQSWGVVGGGKSGDAIGLLGKKQPERETKFGYFINEERRKAISE